MSIEQEMKKRLQEGLSIQSLEIINESKLHAGHAGDDGSGESHFRLNIIANEFSGMPRLERQRKVLEILGKNLTDKIHALSFKCISGDEV